MLMYVYNGHGHIVSLCVDGNNFPARELIGVQAENDSGKTTNV